VARGELSAEFVNVNSRQDGILHETDARRILMSSDRSVQTSARLHAHIRSSLNFCRIAGRKRSTRSYSVAVYQKRNSSPHCESSFVGSFDEHCEFISSWDAKRLDVFSDDFSLLLLSPPL